jgi:hypothetical protein
MQTVGLMAAVAAVGRRAQDRQHNMLTFPLRRPSPSIYYLSCTIGPVDALNLIKNREGRQRNNI